MAFQTFPYLQILQRVVNIFKPRKNLRFQVFMRRLKTSLHKLRVFKLFDFCIPLDVSPIYIFFQTHKTVVHLINETTLPKPGIMVLSTQQVTAHPIGMTGIEASMSCCDWLGAT